MTNQNKRSILAFVCLISGVIIFRDQPGSFLNYLLSIGLVILFWFLSGLKMALTQYKNLLLLGLLFGIVFGFMRWFFPVQDEIAKMGYFTDRHFNPARIAQLKESHETALELYYDHKPSEEERYYSLIYLNHTDDGLHYSFEKTVLNKNQFPRSEKWVENTLASQDIYQNIELIKIWLSQSFTYSLNPGPINSSHPLDEFLFTTRKGFCEHFAGSVATLLKIRGYQTRVSLGFSGGQWNPLFHILTYLDSDAHAWVEVFDEKNQKWMIIDPTLWVSSSDIFENHKKLGFYSILCSVIVFVGALFYYLKRKKITDIEFFIQSLENLEKNYQLQVHGMTLSERVHQLSLLYPKKAALIQKSLEIYLNRYYEKYPELQQSLNLKKSIHLWR